MKLFVILSRVPFPLDKGDKLRAYHQLKQLSKKHTIFLCCLDDSKTDQKHIKHLETFCSEVKVYQLTKYKIYFNLLLGLFSSKPYQVHYFYQQKIHKKILKDLKSFNPDRIYSQLIRTAEYVKNEHDYIKVLDYMDAFSKGIDRRVETAGVLKFLFREEAKRLLKYEHLIFDYFDHHTIISEEDRALIYHENRSTISVIKNGIDTSYFNPENSEKVYDLIFVGNMSYAPNIAAVEFLAKQIFPLLDEKITLLIAGANPSNTVKRLADQYRNITVTGWLNDIRTAYASAKVFVAPLFIGTGLQNKLLEAMSMELPCISTSLVNNSLKAKDNISIKVADDAKQFAFSINELLANKQKRNEFGLAGRNFVKENYSWKNATEKLNDILEQ